MAVQHHPHLLDLSPPASTVAMVEPSSLDHGAQLLGLHVDAATVMSSSSLGGGGADDMAAAAWPPAAVSLSLYNFNAAGGSLFGHDHQQQFAVAAAAAALAPDDPQQLMPASSMQPLFQLRRSKYLGPAQELLAVFCSLEGDLQHAMNDKQQRAPKAGRWGDVETSSSGLWGPLDLLELERRKTRLLSMVEEVDQRYRRYREQMRSVEASFEAVAGGGAAQVYTKLALRAMSRHFRCLRDALVEQARKLRSSAMDNQGQTTLGATKGDTPRLKVLDQCLRQQPGTIDNYPWRPQRGLPERAVAVLRAWLFDHFLHPYPNDVDKHILARQTGLSRSQVSNWFINARVRLWKPMIEDMYTEEVKQQSDHHQAPHQNPTGGGAGAIKPEQQHNTLTTAAMAEESHFRTNLIAGNPTTTASMNVSSSIGGGDEHLHFSSYPPSMHGGAVSLTLGLQQQPSFTSTMMSHHHHRSLMLQGDDEEPAVLPYRDLAGSQLLHDLDLAG